MTLTTMTSADLDDTDVTAFRAAYDALKASRVSGGDDAAMPINLATKAERVAPMSRTARHAEADTARVAQLAKENAARNAWLMSTGTRVRLEMSNTLNRRIRDAYRPAASEVGAEVWRVVAEQTATEREHAYRGKARYKLTTHAGESYGTMTGDHARVATMLDDVIQDARELAYMRLVEMTDDATATACNGECGASECAATLTSELFAVITLTLTGQSVIGWHTLRDVRCGECESCVVGKRGVKSCAKPVTRASWVAVGQIIGASLRNVIHSALKRDPSSGVEWFSGEADQFGYAEIISAETREAAPVVTAVPIEVRELIGKIAATADIAGESVTVSVNGEVSAYVGDALAVAGGYAPTPRGRRSARSALQAVVAGKPGEPVRTGAPRVLTLSGSARPVTRTGLKHDAPVVVLPVTIRSTRDPRVAPRAM